MPGGRRGPSGHFECPAVFMENVSIFITIIRESGNYLENEKIAIKCTALMTVCAVPSCGPWHHCTVSQALPGTLTPGGEALS